MPDIACEIEGRTGRSVYLLNDVSAAAWYLSRHVDADRFIVVTVSSGIGSKIYDRYHRMGVLDQPEYSGEIGHFVVDSGSNAPCCDCGSKGHLGAIASGRGIEKRVRARAREDEHGFRNSLLFSMCHCADKLVNEDHIVPAAVAGDQWVMNIIRNSTLPLSRTLTAVLFAMGLQRIVLLGGFAEALGGVYKDIVCEQMDTLGQYVVMSSRSASLVQIGAGAGMACLQGCGTFMHDRGLLA